jgi:hypothetical protein
VKSLPPPSLYKPTDLTDLWHNKKGVLRSMYTEEIVVKEQQQLWAIIGCARTEQTSPPPPKSRRTLVIMLAIYLLTLEDGTKRLFRNIDNKLPSLAV